MNEVRKTESEKRKAKSESNHNNRWKRCFGWIAWLDRNSPLDEPLDEP
jgi:hypothetical protein